MSKSRRLKGSSANSAFVGNIKKDYSGSTTGAICEKPLQPQAIGVSELSVMPFERVAKGALFENLPVSEPLLSASQTAARLNCSPKTVFHWAKTSYLPCIKLGKLVRFKTKDIEDFIARHRSP